MNSKEYYSSDHINFRTIGDTFNEDNLEESQRKASRTFCSMADTKHSLLPESDTTVLLCTDRAL